MGRPVLLLLDGHSLAYRAFYALPPTLATKTGQVTNAVYGFTSMLIKLLADQGTDRIGVAFDAGKATQRLAAYPEYKAGRRETPDEFRSQLGILREVLDALAIPVFEVREHEADDVLATLALRAAGAGMEAVMVTADRDFLQMVRPGISVLMNRKGMSDVVRYDRDAVIERFGLPPEKLNDYVALKGDASDNLPSVPGVGEKTASELIKLFGSVEELYEHLDELPKRVQRLRPAFENAREQVMLNKKLARLVDDLPIDFELDDIRMGEWDLERIRTLFMSLEFRSLYERLPSVRRTEVAPEPGSPLIARPATPKDLVELASSRDPVAIVPDGSGAAFSLRDGTAVWLEDVSAAEAVLASADCVAHGAKALTVALARRGLPRPRIVFDTQLAAYLLDPAGGTYELSALSQRYLDRELPVAQEAQEQLSFEETANSETACAGAAALLSLAATMEEELERLDMGALYRDIELPLVDVLATMEATGVAIDPAILAEQGAALGAEIESLERECYEHAGGVFNLNSPPQLREILYDKLGLKPSKRTKTGFSTDAATLESLRGEHPIVDALLRYRELSKLKSTYLDALPRLIDPGTGRIHPTIHQTVTTTGRLSTSDPNIQNIPVRTELGRQIRRAFVAPPGHVLLRADYSQIELRVLAHVTGDPGLREAFDRDADIHAATASKVWGYPVDEVPDDLRSRAKMINFGLSYGMGAFGLAQRLGIATDEAADFIAAYFAGFPGVKRFMETVVADAYRDGFTTTLLGRRRYLPELQSSNPRIRSLGERQALNAPIQGTAADIIKLAMIACDRRFAGTTVRMVLSVHDELVFEVPDSLLSDTESAVQSLMGRAYPLVVPLKVDLSSGPNWADAKN